MIRFECDYNQGTHPRILEKLCAANFEQTPGYGEDDYCARARELIRAQCGDTPVDVHFLVGGTQTNLTLIGAALRPHQGAISAESGHISHHEAGAIEATGHKVLVIPSKDGKLSAEGVREAFQAHIDDVTHEHIVRPKLVYISNPTELGTIYTKQELQDIAGVCKSCGLLLYVDGARLGYGLCAGPNDLTIADLAALCDAFYIGGTKVGALFGEALVISNPAIQEEFRYIMKQKGALLAKGWLLGSSSSLCLRTGCILIFPRMPLRSP